MVQIEQSLQGFSCDEPEAAQGASAPYLESIGEEVPNRDVSDAEEVPPGHEFNGYADRYDLLFDVAQLLRQGDPSIGRSTQLCGTAATRIGSPQVYRRKVANSDRTKVRFKQVCHCQSGFACPVCAAWKAGIRAAKLRKVLVATVARKYSAAFMTLTVGHERHHDLLSLIGAIKSAWSAVSVGGWYTRLRRQYDLVGVIVSWDYTYSFEFGHHPHLHILAIGRNGAVLEAAAAMRDRYLANLHGQFRYASSKAQELHLLDLSDDVRKMAAYMAKGPDGVVHHMPWEMSGAERSTRSDKSVSAFDLARRGVAGDHQAAGLFREYVAATKGLQSCVLRKTIWESALDIDLGPEEAKQHPDDDDGQVWELLGSLPVSVWNRVRSRRKLGYLARLVMAGLPFVEVMAQARAIAGDEPEFPYWPTDTVEDQEDGYCETDVFAGESVSDEEQSRARRDRRSCHPM